MLIIGNCAITWCLDTRSIDINISFFLCWPHDDGQGAVKRNWSQKVLINTILLMATTVDISKVARLPLRHWPCLANYHQLDYPAFFCGRTVFCLISQLWCSSWTIRKYEFCIHPVNFAPVWIHNNGLTQSFMWLCHSFLRGGWVLICTEEMKHTITTFYACNSGWHKLCTWPIGRLFTKRWLASDKINCRACSQADSIQNNFLRKQMFCKKKVWYFWDQNTNISHFWSIWGPIRSIFNLKCKALFLALVGAILPPISSLGLHFPPFRMPGYSYSHYKLLSLNISHNPNLWHWR